ncbi:hypothetical protein BJV77DRAFT_1072024 [Russula vinacea]|nr:hypothetical protein BJV77DRAFT_1072024 [Russula vinacea]
MTDTTTHRWLYMEQVDPYPDYLSPSTPLVIQLILVRLKRLILAIPNALQKLSLFQIPAAAPVRLELSAEFGFTTGRRVDVRFPLERGHLTSLTS